MKVLFIRKVLKAAKRSFQDVTRAAFQGLNVVQEEGKVTFKNGSALIFDGYNKLNELDKFIGLEFDEIIIEELTQLPKDVFVSIDSCCRTSRLDGWVPRLYLTTNPGGLGHRWVKEMFIMPYRAHTQKDTIFVPWNYKSNPFIDKRYGKYLENNGYKVSVFNVMDVKHSLRYNPFAYVHSDLDIVVISYMHGRVGNDFAVNRDLTLFY